MKSKNIKSGKSSRYKRNLQYIREKNGIRLNLIFNKLRSFFTIKNEMDESILSVMIKDHIDVTKNKLFKKYKIPVTAKTVRIGHINDDFIQNKITFLVEYVADYYYKGEFQLIKN